MPNINNQKMAQSKKGLGRGLGSLLGADASDFGDKKSNAQPTPPAQPKKQNIEQKATQPVPKTRDIETVQAPIKSEPAPVVQAKSIENKEIDPGLRIWSLAIEKIVPNQTQPRKDFHKEPLQELAASIKEQGILQPITVRKLGDKYEIIAGERRWRASQLAGLKVVPAIIKNVSDQKSMELALIENLQREDLNPVEEAMGYQLLIDDYTLSQQDLAQKVGKSRSTVANALRLLTLPRDIRQMLRQGLISMGHSKVLMSVEDPETQIKLARKTINKKLSVRALENEIKQSKRPEAESIGDMNVSERLARGLAQELQKTMGTKVGIQYKKGKGRLEISFYSDDELSQYCEKIKTAWKTR